MVGSASQASLAQRMGLALAQALRAHRGAELTPTLHDGRIRRLADLLIEGIDDEQLPGSLDRTRLRSPDSAAALAVNTFLPWQTLPHELPLCGWVGFDAIQFEVRCPTGLRGTPPHLDLLALRGHNAVAVTIRCSEYLSRRKSAVAPSYDRLLADTPGIAAWQRELDSLRRHPGACRYVDLGALIKYALALARTFPERSAILLYLFWEPMDARQFEDFRRHRDELHGLVERTQGARIEFAAQSFGALWRDWEARPSPHWLADHVRRLRARYCVSISEQPAL
jgi:hypothetical protein